MPKKVKFRKMQKGNMNGKAYSGSEVSFGEFGLKAMEPGWVSSRQIEAARIAVTRHVKRGKDLFLFGCPPHILDVKKALGYTKNDFDNFSFLETHLKSFGWD